MTMKMDPPPLWVELDSPLRTPGSPYVKSTAAFRIPRTPVRGTEEDTARHRWPRLPLRRSEQMTS
jgi:hypothetical protein